MELPEMNDREKVVYGLLVEAADLGQVCPTYEAINEVLDCESASVPPMYLWRLQRKGLINVKRYQRFREVQIIATGKWTKRSEAMHKTTPHVPRGTHDPKPLVNALAESFEAIWGVAFSDDQSDLDGLPDGVGTVQNLSSIERKLNRCIELINRRKNHLLTGGA